ncbi:MAG: hypothetical protein IPM42_14415 [Saprospiraceae bacterium]|nr:hypothetical protein [Saprospiraceae bacterium]
MIENSSQYFGVIQMQDIKNIPLSSYSTDSSLKDLWMYDRNYKFVHYPDCQQLILWLPDHYRQYENIQIQDLHSREIIFNHSIEEVISGSIQILIDTLFIHPGEFELTVKKKDGLQHIVQFKKYPEGQFPEVERIIEPEIDPDKAPIVYRDGFGNILPNEDLILREKTITNTINKITRHLEYVSQGRDGEVIYIEGEKRIKFLMEMGAYDCVFYINIPSATEWEASTKFPLSEREDIITFVAEQTQRDQASSCVYKISDREISYYRKR